MRLKNIYAAVYDEADEKAYSRRQEKGRSLGTPALLEGEDPETACASDARHWIAIYAELVEFQRELLERMHNRPANEYGVRSTKSVTRSSAERARLDRWLVRLDFWLDKHWLLQGLELDSESRILGCRGRSVRLTRREMQLLSVFMARPKKFFAVDQLMLQAWHDPGLAPDEVRIYLSRLRKKLAALGAAEIEHISQLGYRLLFKGVDADRRAGRSVSPVH